MKKMLDLCCCSGGASFGYNKAGFEVTGVDFKDQPNYPFLDRFIKSDIFAILNDTSFLKKFDVIHISPPCQGYSHATKDNSKHVSYSQGKQTPRLISSVRALIPIGMPYIIENVAGAKNELINPFILTGFMFGLPIDRKRYFESNLFFTTPENKFKRGITKKYAFDHGIDYRDMSVTGKSRRTGCIDVWKNIMQMPWCGRAWELSEAIPPAYTEYIGKKILELI